MEMAVKSLFITLYIIGYHSIGFTQNIQSIKGSVVDENENQLIGNAILLDLQDSSFVLGTSFFEEDFILESINRPRVLLKLTSLGFADRFIDIEYQGKDQVDIGRFIMDNQGIEMDEVIIKGKLPRIIQRENGTIELNVAQTSLASSNSFQEIVMQLPGVIIDDEGISVIGKETTIIYQNGQRIAPENVSFIDPGTIKSIEIIRNPSAKYDADGGAVIHIKTISKQEDGYQIRLKQNISDSYFFGTNFRSSVNANFTKGPFKLTGSIGFFQGDDREILHTTRDRLKKEVFLLTDLTTDWETKNKPSPNGLIGLHYDINDKNYISLEYSDQLQQSNVIQTSNNTITDSEYINWYESVINGSQQLRNQSTSMNYNRAIDTLGTRLFMGIQYSKIMNTRFNLIDETSFEKNELAMRDLQSNNGYNIGIYAGQLDYSKYLSSRTFFELGTKWSQVNNDAFLDFSTKMGSGEYLRDSTLSNAFGYQENIWSVYANHHFHANDKIKLSIGLRNEITTYQVKVNGVVGDVNDQFVNLFPYLNINILLPNNRPLSISYTSSIRRPSYHSLNPSLYYQDPYTSIQGNTELVPQKTHSVEAASEWFKTNVKLGYNYTIDPLGGSALPGDTEYSYVLKPVNFQFKHYGYLDLSRGFQFDWYTSNNSITLSYTDIRENVFKNAIQRPRPHIYFYSNHIFDIGKSFKAEFLFWYWGNKYEGVTHREDMANTAVTLEKSFLNKSLLCRLSVNDIFGAGGPSGYYSVGETDIFFERQRNTEYFRLSVMYNFGQLKKINFKNKSAGKSEMNRSL